MSQELKQLLEEELDNMNQESLNTFIQTWVNKFLREAHLEMFHFSSM